MGKCQKGVEVKLENRVGAIAGKCDLKKRVERWELRHIRVENIAF
ncbi:hypothetical protein C4J88_3016 [Pseudomonas sp. R4-39-08]|nr:hypothetical protein C4J88_3016 [Pseudomonas sp. R4-39-08]